MPRVWHTTAASCSSLMIWLLWKVKRVHGLCDYDGPPIAAAVPSIMLISVIFLFRLPKSKDSRTLLQGLLKNLKMIYVCQQNSEDPRRIFRKLTSACISSPDWFRKSIQSTHKIYFHHKPIGCPLRIAFSSIHFSCSFMRAFVLSDLPNPVGLCSVGEPHVPPKHETMSLLQW